MCELYSPIRKFIANKRKKGVDKVHPLVREIDVKGVALKTHQRLCLWKPQAFEKA
jgi:hypothetical protein